MRKCFLLCQMFAIFLVANAFAQTRKPVTVVQDLPGWQCMALTSSYESDGINAPPAPVYAGPETSSPQIGSGAGVIIAPDPLNQVNGRTIIIQPGGRKAWIDTNLLTKWHALSNPNAVCTPAILSNGRYGFRTSG
jgi:hypothetical protein